MADKLADNRKAIACSFIFNFGADVAESNAFHRDADRPIERIFMPTSREPAPEQSVEERLVKEIRFDPDAWIVETEDRAGRHFLDLARA